MATLGGGGVRQTGKKAAVAAKTGVKHGDGSGGGAKRGMPNERDHDGTLGVRSAKVICKKPGVPRTIFKDGKRVPRVYGDQQQLQLHLQSTSNDADLSLQERIEQRRREFRAELLPPDARLIQPIIGATTNPDYLFAGWTNGTTVPLVRGILVGVDEGETMQHLPKININLAIGAHKELMIVYAWNNEVSSLRDVNHIGALYSFHNCKAMANIGIDERKGTENYRGGDFPVRLLFGAQSRWVYGGKLRELEFSEPRQLAITNAAAVDDDDDEVIELSSNDDDGDAASDDQDSEQDEEEEDSMEDDGDEAKREEAAAGMGGQAPVQTVRKRPAAAAADGIEEVQGGGDGAPRSSAVAKKGKFAGGDMARGTGTSAPVAVQENVVVLAAPTERRASAEAATALAVGNEGVQGGGGGTSSSSALHPFVAAKKGKLAGGDMARATGTSTAAAAALQEIMVVVAPSEVGSSNTGGGDEAQKVGKQ